MFSLAQEIAIIPQPVSVQNVPGGSFVLNKAQTVFLSPVNETTQALAGYLTDHVASQTGLQLRVSDVEAPDGNAAGLQLRLRSGKANLGEEGYTLNASATGVILEAKTPAGLFYGIQSLLQLLPARPLRDDVQIPAVQIFDRPRFAYRGMHLDVARHFFSISFIKKYIDVLAMHKMNVFHWHLTDDQGWRIEIKRYPKLTEIGAFRDETVIGHAAGSESYDGKRYGGFYTQDEVREVVAYARSRFITVIPEIEMPGHAVAALTAYPQFACTEGPFRVMRTWGISKDIFCPKEETFAFLENILTEVLDLFPSSYIHIGGDEAPKDRWKESTMAQEVIRQEGLKDEHELQSYFIRRIEAFLNAKGRKLIGWDEILEGGLSPNATVMSWRGMDGAIAAAQQGHDAIMTPTSFCYFDYYQGDKRFEPMSIGGYLPLEKVYNYEPIPAQLTQDEARHILGTQGNVWAEYLPETENVEYMAFPRATALAEVAWTPVNRKNWLDFQTRLQQQFARLDAMNVRYWIPPVQGLGEDRVVPTPTEVLTLQSMFRNGEIRYTLDGTTPTLQSRLYAGLLTISVPPSGITVSARVFTENGRGSVTHRVRLRSSVPKAGVRIKTPTEGLQYAVYQGGFPALEAVNSVMPVRSGALDHFRLPTLLQDGRYAIQWTGYFWAPEDGVYTFKLAADNLSALEISGETIIRQQETWGQAKGTAQISLKKGYHPFRLVFADWGGAHNIRLTYLPPNQTAEQLIPASSWFR